MTEQAAIPQPTLLDERVLRFNLMPVEDMDESWLDGLPNGRLWPVVKQSADGRRWFSKYILDQFHLTGRYWTDFSKPRARLALIDRRALQTVFFYIGLTLKSADIRSEVNGAKLKELRAELGPDAMNFAFRSAPLIGAPPRFAIKHDTDNMRSGVMLAGAAYAVHAGLVSTEAYIKRLCLRLPRAMAEKLQETATGASPDGNADELPRLVRRVVKEVAPQWLPLFS